MFSWRGIKIFLSEINNWFLLHWKYYSQDLKLVGMKPITRDERNPNTIFNFSTSFRKSMHTGVSVRFEVECINTRNSRFLCQIFCRFMKVGLSSVKMINEWHPFKWLHVDVHSTWNRLFWIEFHGASLKCDLVILWEVFSPASSRYRHWSHPRCYTWDRKVV